MKPTQFNHFESPISKVKRAKRKASELKQIVGGYLAQKPYRVGANLNQVGHFYEFGIQRTIPIPDDLIGAINEVVHILRGALDNLAVDLVLYESGCTKHLSYPIANDEIGFNKLLNDGKINQAGQSVIDELRKFETYKGGKGEIVHGIHNIDISDKHYWDAKFLVGVHIKDLHMVFPNGKFNRFKSIDFLVNEKTIIFDVIPALTKFKRNEAFVTGIYLHDGAGLTDRPLTESIDLTCDYIDGIVSTFSTSGQFRSPKLQKAIGAYPY